MNLLQNPINLYGEKFREIEGYEGYEISNYARVRHYDSASKKQTIVTPYYDETLCPYVVIPVETFSNVLRLKFLVAQAFLGYKMGSETHIVVNTKQYLSYAGLSNIQVIPL